MYFERGDVWLRQRVGFADADPLNSTRAQMTRIAIGLRLWLRRAIKRINERTMMRIVDMVSYDSLRALYKPIRIVELD